MDHESGTGRFYSAIRGSVALSIFVAVLWFGSSPLIGLVWQDYRSGTMSPFGFLDKLIANSWSPFLMALLIGGLCVIWFVRLPLDTFWAHWRTTTKRAFFDQFNDPENARARHAFRFILWEAYRAFDPTAKADDLPSLIDSIEWPRERLPSESVFAYVQSIDWPNKEGKTFWAFCEKLFQPIFDGSKPTLVDEKKFNELVEARRAAAKFWDAWAHQIEDRLIGITEVQEALKGNKMDIKALAIAEMHSAKMGWDRGGGKVMLFKLAQRHLSFGPEPLGRRTRRRIAAWISPDG